MIRNVQSDENILSDEILSTVRKKKPQKKNRNYSFRESRRLPYEKMTEVNGIKVPSMPGCCYHAIIATLAQNKEKFCGWDKIIQLTQENMRRYGGEKTWKRFIGKDDVKSYEQRIKYNTHTLTRTGKDCYGYRLHELGMCIYYFKDGAMLLTGGELKKGTDKHDVIFPDGRRLQVRYRGTTMTHKEYKKFLEKGLINSSGKILKPDEIKKVRNEGASKAIVEKSSQLHVCVVLDEHFDQSTADRMEMLGFSVESALANELIGIVPASSLEALKSDKDVIEVEVSGE